MCGIAGLLTPDHREAERVLSLMVASMVHRGPDDGGIEVLPARLPDGSSGVVGLGFRRLAILDLTPAGHQPMVDPETGNCIVFNGEIYNHRRLRSELEAAGCRFRSTSDTEVLLHALGRWGEKALDRLEGMYSFAFARADDRGLLLARDPLGIKPMYVAEVGDRVLFASEIRTLLASGLVPRDLSAEGIGGLIAFGSVQAPHTVFERIIEFPAGHFQWVGRPSRRFWEFPEIREIPGPSESGLPDLVRERVRAAVRSHLVADVPVGVLLSAGIDSTIVAACAAETGGPVSAFTVSIGDRYPEDEAATATATAKALEIDHHVVPIRSTELRESWPQWIRSLDSPSIDGFNTWLVTKALAERGMKVGLSGLGADELFGGYPVFETVPKLLGWLDSVQVLPRRLVARTAETMLRFAGRPGPAEKVPDLLTGRRDLGAVLMGMRRITSDAKLARLGAVLPRSAVPSVPHPEDAFSSVSRIELTHYMRNTLLRDSDANSMKHALELRVPFLDLPLVTAVSELPGRLRRSASGPGKRLLREAMAKHLPTEVMSRPKTGFSLPIAEWMRGEMRDHCAGAVEFCGERAGLRGAEVRRVWDRYVKGGSEAWALPFAMVVLGEYLRKLDELPG